MLMGLASRRFRGGASGLALRLNDGRGDRIRTCDPLLPKQMRYQAALLPAFAASAASAGKPAKGIVSSPLRASPPKANSPSPALGWLASRSSLKGSEGWWARQD